MALEKARQLSGRAAGGPCKLPGGTDVGRLGAVEVPDGAAVPGRGAATAAAAAGESHTCMVVTRRGSGRNLGTLP
ncbi:uncharacterized protein LOC135091527 isoform X2 [Scylla paramamosain]|uniref:uncharacterized protein LOC135091527 isoform X2 n=1 Tax=Scylla paramamosain TaxID=85552 RepID=UPI003083C432